MISERIGLMSYIGFSCLHRTPELTTIRRVYRPTVGLQLTQNALRNAVRWTTRHLMWDVTGGYVLRVGTHYPCSRAVLTSRTVNEWTSPRVLSFWHSWTRALPDNALSTRPVFTVTTRDDGCSTHYTVFTGSEPHVGGRPVPSWARVSGVADARRMEFSNSSWQFRAVKSLICSFNNSISSRTANSRWLFTRSYDDSNQSTLILFYFILAIILFQRPAHVK